MIETNQLIVDGWSTADFSFPVFVEENDGFQYPKKKNRLIETDYATGAIKDEIKAWPSISKDYVLYCPTATLKDMREIKRWAKDTGNLRASDEPDVYYEILDVAIDKTKIDDISGYRISLHFTTQPFGFELNPDKLTLKNGDTFFNRTNAPMYPRIKVVGNSQDETRITIGEQTIRLKEINNSLTIECKYLEQDVLDSNGNRANSIMYGEFFEVPKDSENEVVLSAGIDYIEMLGRWAWL